MTDFPQIDCNISDMRFDLPRQDCIDNNQPAAGDILSLLAMVLQKMHKPKSFDMINILNILWIAQKSQSFEPPQKWLLLGFVSF